MKMNTFRGDVTLDGKQIIMPNDAYYIPPTYFEEPYAAWGTDLYLVQGIACKIIPLSVGVHEIELHSGFGEIFDPPIVYHNTWTITVVPGR